jgi:hypothetical protein
MEHPDTSGYSRIFPNKSVPNGAVSIIDCPRTFRKLSGIIQDIRMLFYCQGNFEFLKTKAPFYVARFF